MPSTALQHFIKRSEEIENALSSSVYAITNTTLMQANVQEIELTICFLCSLGIRTFAMNRMIYSGGGYRDPDVIPEQEMGPLLLQIRDLVEELEMRFLWYTPTEYCRMLRVELKIGAKRCNAGEYLLCVEPNGDILPCQSYYASVGNLLRDPWEHIWQGELFYSFRDREKDPQRLGLPEKCWECPNLPLCGSCSHADQLVQLSPIKQQEQAISQSGFVPVGQLVSTAVRSTGNGVD